MTFPLATQDLFVVTIKEDPNTWVQSPGIGTFVYYQDYDTLYNGPSPVSPALVTLLTNDRLTVGLCIFKPTHLQFLQSVSFSKEPQVGHWSWTCKPVENKAVPDENSYDEYLAQQGVQ